MEPPGNRDRTEIPSRETDSLAGTALCPSSVVPERLPSSSLIPGPPVRVKTDEYPRETPFGARATMTKQTVAGNAYRWAHPVIEQMVRNRPAAALDFLQADSTTKHFVALAVRGWEAHQDRSERVLWQLSGEIFSRPPPHRSCRVVGNRVRQAELSEAAPRPRFDAAPVRRAGYGLTRPAAAAPPAPVLKDLAQGARDDRAFR